MSTPLILEGNCWKFGHNIPTDMITPTAYVMRGMGEMVKHVLENANPDFPKNVQKGDIVVAGRNFGCSSGRAIAPKAIKATGVGAVRIIQAILPGMRQRKSGRIVNITSLAGLVPLPFWGMYNASKFALEGLTETLRYELAPFAIHVSAIEAGLIRTRFYTDDRKAAPIEAYQPWHRRFRKTMAEFERKAPGPELVAEAVSKAVHAARPALRYKVTREATQFTLLRRFMPAGIFERALRAGFHLDDQKY